MTTTVPSDPAEARTTQAGVRHQAGYSFGPAVVDVDTDTDGDSRWLAEFLTPWAAATAFGSGDVRVHLNRSDPVFDALDRRSGTANARLIPCFALDSRLVTLPGWDDGGGTVLADEELGCFYQVHGRSVHIVARQGERRARLGLMRVVREALAARRLARGRLLDLHAAAIQVGQRAVLIAGPKHVGKTTLLCHALASGGARLLANDRVFVDVDQTPGVVYGVPTLVSVRPATLELFPDLRRGPAERPVLLHAGEHEETSDVAAHGRDFSLSPAQLARRLDSTCVPSAPLGAIVFPEISSDADTWIVDALGAAEGLALLGACVYGGHREGQSRTILDELGGLGPPRADTEAMAGRVADEVRFLRCRLGPHAYDRGADAWLRALGLEAAGERTR